MQKSPKFPNSGICAANRSCYLDPIWIEQKAIRIEHKATKVTNKESRFSIVMTFVQFFRLKSLWDSRRANDGWAGMISKNAEMSRQRFCHPSRMRFPKSNLIWWCRYRSINRLITLVLPGHRNCEKETGLQFFFFPEGTQWLAGRLSGAIPPDRTTERFLNPGRIPENDGMISKNAEMSRQGFCHPSRMRFPKSNQIRWCR